MKTRILIKEGENRLWKAGCADAKIDSEDLYCYLTGKDRVHVFLRADDEVDRGTEERYLSLIDRRAMRIPAQHITGRQEFMGYSFKVTPDVLIPRQDTETLVTEAAKIVYEHSRENLGILDRIRGKKEWRILDLCCGSGAVGISLEKICGNVRVTGTDVSAAALEVAGENSRRLHAKVKLIRGDMFGAVRGSRFDMIVSNPPYIRSDHIALLQEEVKGHEPLTALDGGRDGLDFYREIAGQAAGHLRKGGWLLMEIGCDQGEAVRRLLEDSGRFTPAEIIKDLPGKDRVVECRLR